MRSTNEPNKSFLLVFNSHLSKDLSQEKNQTLPQRQPHDDFIKKLSIEK